MSTLESLVVKARDLGASDIHLEGGLPAAMRVQGELRMIGDAIAPHVLTAVGRELLTSEEWDQFLERGSFDLSKAIQGARCRINILHSSRGVGMAVRLLSSFTASLSSLNLHPDLKKLVSHRHGLIMVSGATGSGKSSTVAALLQEINVNETRHIVTIESPIEYVLTPRRSLIRQRQVGRDTPSFEQALIDAMREDPDVLMVGEMRDPETMRLTLNAAETGHLVITTLHSSNVSEAVARVINAFPAEIQPGISAQLADCLVGIVSQRLRFREDVKMRVAECELLVASSGVRGTIRAGQYSRLSTALETGGQEGQWTLPRYRSWLDSKTDWVMPGDRNQEQVPADLPMVEPVRMPIKPAASSVPSSRPAARPTATKSEKRPAPPASDTTDDGVLVINEVDEDPAAILERMQRGR